MRILFLHGAGGFVEDRPLAEGFATVFEAALDLPRLPDDDLSVQAWSAIACEGLAALGPDDLVIAHSFGATMLVHALGQAGVEPPRRALLLAMPDWSPDGWDVPQYALRGPEPSLALTLHHCRDDDEVPFSHLRLNAARLPSARVREHQVGGHQFAGLLDAIAADTRSAE